MLLLQPDPSAEAGVRLPCCILESKLSRNVPAAPRMAWLVELAIETQSMHWRKSKEPGEPHLSWESGTPVFYQHR